MHIAVLVYGRLNKCVEHYNNIINCIGNKHTIDFFLSSDDSPENLLNDFIRIYKPVLYNNDPIKYEYDLRLKYPVPYDITNVHNMTCHFKNKNRVFALLEDHMSRNNAHYDVAVSLRIDVRFNSVFNFNSVVNNTIYIPSGYDYVDNGINDQIAYGTVDVMKKHNSIDPVYLLENKLSILHPESLNYANIRLHKLKIVRVHLNYHLSK